LVLFERLAREIMNGSSTNSGGGVSSRS